MGHRHQTPPDTSSGKEDDDEFCEPLVKQSVVHSNRPKHVYKILCPTLGSVFRDAFCAVGKKRSGMGGNLS